MDTDAIADRLDLLRPEPGDVLVLRLEDEPTPERAQAIGELFASLALPCPVLVVLPGQSLELEALEELVAEAKARQLRETWGTETGADVVEPEPAGADA